MAGRVSLRTIADKGEWGGDLILKKKKKRDGNGNPVTGSYKQTVLYVPFLLSDNISGVPAGS